MDINAVGSTGNTALHYAVEANDLDMVKVILKCGVDRYILNENR